MNELKSEETKLVGGKIRLENKFIEDETSVRINWLIRKQLKKLTSDKSGWYVLYQDLNDNRYWELSYPESELHGGGMPMLTNISVEDVHSRYQLKPPRSS